MFETAGDFVKAEIFGNPVHSPRPGIRLERPDEQFPGVVFVVSAIIVIAKHRERVVYPLNAFEQYIIMFAGVQRCGYTHACSQIPGPHAPAYDNIIGVY